MIKLMITALLIWSSSTFSSEKCSHPYISYSKDELRVREQWDHLGFSGLMGSINPKYLVTMIDLKYMWSESFPKDSWAHRLLLDPDMISNNTMISASVISSARQKTVFSSRIGLVLDVPCELIGPMYAWDMGSGGWKDDAIDIRYRKHFSAFPEVMSPNQFLLESSPAYHNEVLVLGKHPYNQKVVKVKGILLGCDDISDSSTRAGIYLKKTIDKNELEKCLETYSAKKQIIPLLKKLNERYNFYFKLHPYHYAKQ